MTEEKINRQKAEEEFDRFCEYYDIDLDNEGVDENEQRDSARDRAFIIKAIMQGRATVAEDGRLTYVCKHPNARGNTIAPLIFYQGHGSGIITMDKKKKHADVGKMFASMAEITKMNAALFSGMAMKPDLETCMAVWTLLMV